MRVIIPTLDLKIFGFREIDIINLNRILSSDTLKDYFELEAISGQLFDFGAFVSYIIENKDFRKEFINSCYLCLDDFPNCILNNMPLIPGDLSFKFNLFLLLLVQRQFNRPCDSDEKQRNRNQPPEKTVPIRQAEGFGEETLESPEKKKILTGRYTCLKFR